MTTSEIIEPDDGAPDKSQIPAKSTHACALSASTELLGASSSLLGVRDRLAAEGSREGAGKPEDRVGFGPS